MSTCNHDVVTVPLTPDQIASIRGYASLAKVQKHRRSDASPRQVEELCERVLKAESLNAELITALATWERIIPAIEKAMGNDAWDLTACCRTTHAILAEAKQEPNR